MSRMSKISFVSLIGMLVVLILTMYNKANEKISNEQLFNIVVIVWGVLIIGVVLTCIGFVMYCISRKKKTTKKYIGKYDLEILDNSDKDVYVIKIYGRDGWVYSFTWIDDEEKRKNCSINYGNVNIKQDSGNYVEIFEQQYNVGGFLDYLFFNETLAEKNKFVYDLYVADGILKK